MQKVGTTDPSWPQRGRNAEKTGRNRPVSYIFAEIGHVDRLHGHGENPMPAEAPDSITSEETIDQLLNQAEAEARTDPRSGIRFPFFRLVSIGVDDRSYAGFSRDICAASIGLLHSMELPRGEVDVTIPIATDKKCKMRVRIERCEPCGEGWYISGGKFVGISPATELDDELFDALLAARE
jgi:hypothetical protein